ncbi:rare lipoprotein A [Roseibium hamelinense]|uniref:Endolytic peptidoglycan transglycosylase RlpA n=2 Tax=Roseibium hamelinense TaxID=150831 RepID=A0A562T135_9HYPH|nr:rare lipoprotein A [Roseibium hamelinense]
MRSRIVNLIGAATLTVGLGSMPAVGANTPVPKPTGQSAQCGNASWYALNGITANGEKTDPTALTAAHRNLPFGTMVKVKNLANGREVLVRINDRGPFVDGRVIDVTKAAAARLGFIRKGVTRVRITFPAGIKTFRARYACK